jgi:hypothetical protein
VIVWVPVYGGNWPVRYGNAYVPGYGVWPVRPLDKTRVIGQAAPQFLGDVTDVSQAARAAQRRLETSILGAPVEDGTVRKWPWWLRAIGVSTVALQEWSSSDGEPPSSSDSSGDAIEVLVAHELPQSEINRLIPRQVDGIPVYVHRSGEIRLLKADGANDMGETLEINTDIHGETLRQTFLDEIPAHGGRYVRVDGTSYVFCLDPLTRVMLFLRGVEKPPCSVPADKLVCWKTVPTHPLVGGFTHPNTGFHCRSEAIPVEWDVLLHGRPGLTLRDGDGNLLSALGDTGSSATPIERAQALARKINERIGGLGSAKAEPWWLYTLPSLKSDGSPLVTIGIKGDYQPDAKELKALPWIEWRNAGVPIRVEFVPPKGTNISSSSVEITPAGSPALIAAPAGMGSAPIDTVWPTSSPDYREPTGPATGDDDLGIGSLMVAPSGMGQSSHGFPLRWRDPARYNHPRPIERWAPLPVRAPQWPWPPGPPGDAADEGGGDCRPADGGLGYAPVVAMPTGMLNWDRVTGYEGQPWVTKDWSGQGFMGDATPGPAAPAAAPSRKGLVVGAIGAVLGGAASFVASSRRFAPEGRVSAETPVIAGATAAGALASFVVAKAVVEWWEKSS